MRSFWIVQILFVVLIACSPLSLMPGLTEDIMLTDTQEVLNKLRALCCEDGWWSRLSEAEYIAREGMRNGEELDAGAVFLESLDAAGGKFDPNEYFTVLTHLSLEDGYVLDYVYFAPGGGDGAPYLYARPEGEPAFANYSEYKKAGAENYLNHIQVDGTAEGYYELAVLSIMGGQFYLAWHFGYNDWEVVGSRERVEAIIELMNENHRPLTEEQEEAALQLDVTPRVKIGRDKVRVWLLVFTKWGGFYERVYTIDREFPHQMIEDEIQLVPYESGVVY
jgi:hypothetical protein